MDMEEILAENKNKDVFKQAVLKQASKSAVIVQSVTAVFFATQLLVGKDINWGLWAIVFTADMTAFLNLAVSTNLL